MADERKKNDSEQPECERAEQKPRPKIAPASVKIGEDRDNLRRRGEWFERRSGKQ
jgi:hypothetical protein